MKALFGFTVGGIMMTSVILIMVFSMLGTFVSQDSKKSVIQNVNSVLNLDSPEMCRNFSDEENCIGQFAYLKRDPNVCISYIEDKESQYDCISNFFRKYKEKACNFLDAKYHDRCITDIENLYRE